MHTSKHILSKLKLITQWSSIFSALTLFLFLSTGTNQIFAKPLTSCNETSKILKTEFCAQASRQTILSQNLQFLAKGVPSQVLPIKFKKDIETAILQQETVTVETQTTAIVKKSYNANEDRSFSSIKPLLISRSYERSIMALDDTGKSDLQSCLQHKSVSYENSELIPQKYYLKAITMFVKTNLKSSTRKPKRDYEVSEKDCKNLYALMVGQTHK